MRSLLILILGSICLIAYSQDTVFLKIQSYNYGLNLTYYEAPDYYLIFNNHLITKVCDHHDKRRPPNYQIDSFYFIRSRLFYIIDGKKIPVSKYIDHKRFKPFVSKKEFYFELKGRNETSIDSFLFGDVDSVLSLTKYGDSLAVNYCTYREKHSGSKINANKVFSGKSDYDILFKRVGKDEQETHVETCYVILKGTKKGINKLYSVYRKLKLKPVFVKNKM